ncbi:MULTISPECIES: hypothetical protein [Cupriavidus]
MKFHVPIATIGFCGMRLQLRACEGVVQEVQQDRQSEIETTRNAAGNLASVKLVTDALQEIWLRQDDGTETRVPVGGVTVALRDGHRLRAYYATLDRFQPLPAPGVWYRSMLTGLGPLVATALCFVVGSAVGAGAKTVGLPFELGVLAGFGCFGGLLYQHFQMMGAVKAFGRHALVAVAADH